MNDYDFLAVDYQASKQSGSGQKIYADISEDDLETVLPASADFKTSEVMVLHGTYKGDVGRILSKDKKK